MFKRLPSLNALKAFETAARLNSFSLAAAEMNVTHAAISRHIRDLEAALAIKLFHRTGRGVALTDNGRLLSLDVTPAFEQLSRAIERFGKPATNGQLIISADVSFAALWLLPRLGRFTAQHPNVHVVLDPENRLVDFSKNEAHLGIRFGKGEWRDVEAIKIAGSHVAPVCSPSLMKKLSPRTPAALTKTVLLAEENHDLWMNWLTGAGVRSLPKLAGPILKGHLAIAAAEAGQGFALADAVQSVDGILAGKLVRPFPVEFATSEAYYLVRGAGRRESSLQTAMRLWLQHELSASLTALSCRLASPAPERKEKRAPAH